MKANVLRIVVPTTLAAVVALAGCGSTSAAGQGSGKSTGKNIVIGFSQSYTGNQYRQAEDKDFMAVAQKLKNAGKISGVDFLNANNSVSTQVSQIDDLILKHVSILIVDPASPTALNGAIAKAVAAGIPVLAFNDGPVTSTKAYQFNFNNPKMDEVAMQYVANRLHGHGNVLLIRGIAGTGTDNGFYQGMQNVLKKYPGLKAVGTVYGNWTESVAQSKVASILPSLPTVNAIVTEGGEGYGAIQAFNAAGKPVPLVVGGNRGVFLNWWAQQAQKGYKTMSISANPWIGGAAVYVAMDILNHQKVPKNMTMPLLQITQNQLSQYANVPLNGIAQKAYSNSWVTAHVIK